MLTLALGTAVAVGNTTEIVNKVWCWYLPEDSISTGFKNTLHKSI